MVVRHELKIQNIFDLITKIAGVPNLLITITTLMLQSFSNFNSNVQMIDTLKKSRLNTKEKPESKKKKKGGKKVTPKKTKRKHNIFKTIQMFIMKGSSKFVKKLLSCCFSEKTAIKTKDEVEEIEIIEKVL